MKIRLNELLKSASVGEPVFHRAMGIAPVFASAATPVDFLTLDDAMREGAVEVTEIDAGGSVPQLLVRNRSERKVFLLDGEELVGAKQNRILNTDVLIAANSKTVIPVSCVEQGRWHHTSKAFSSGDAVAPQQMRREKAQQVHDSLSAQAGHTSNQGAVWNTVEKMSRKLEVRSSTSSLHDVYTTRSRDVAEFAEAFPHVAGANGIMFLLGGAPFSSDLFESADTMAAYWPKIVRSCALDAMGRGDGEKREPAPAELRTMFERACDAEVQVFDSPGLGNDLRLRGHGVAGAALVHEDAAVHVELFATESGRDGSSLASPSRRRPRYL